MLDGMQGRLSEDEILLNLYGARKPFEKGVAAWLARFFGL